MADVLPGEIPGDERGKRTLMGKQKNNAVQIVRSIAIMFVILMHTYKFSADVFSVIGKNLLNGGVPLFLFLSGYCTDISNAQKIKIKRIKKVIMPYLVWSMVYIIVDIIKKIMTDSLDIRNLFYNELLSFATFNTSKQLYYIFVYIQLVIITPIICKIVNNNYKHWRKILYAISPVAIIVLVYFRYASNEKISFPLDYFFAYNFIYYYLGLVIDKGRSKRLTIILHAILMLLSIVLLQQECRFWIGRSWSMAYTALKLSSVFFSICLILLAKDFISNVDVTVTSIIQRFLIRFGDYSFAFYLSHMLVIDLIEIISNDSIEGILFPLNAGIVMTIDALLIYIIRRILSPKRLAMFGMERSL